MRLKTKFTVLVALCTFALLGSFYQLSKNSAERTFLAFNQQSAITIGNRILDEDEVAKALQEQQAASLPATLNYLAKAFPKQVFIWRNLAPEGPLIIQHTKLSLEHERVDTGHQFTIRHDDGSVFVLQFGRAQLPLTIAGQQGELFWLPQALLERARQKDALQQAMIDDFMLSLMALSAIAVVLAWLGSWYFLSPLKRLKRAFKAIESGKLDTRLILSRSDEVGEIINSFNNLAAWLQGLHQQYKQMNSDLSHELRTPLTAIRSRLEAMEDGIVAMDKAQLAVVMEEITNVNRIIDDLCLLSLTESQQLQLCTQLTNVSELMESLYTRYKPQAQQSGVVLNADIQPDVNVIIDAQRVRQIVVNLLDNAFKYGADGGQISMHLSYQQQQLTIMIADNGKGMEQAQLSQIFERFYRVQQSRHDNNSLGLGLPICQQLAQLMGAELTTSSSPGLGSEFIFKLSVPA